MPSARFNNGSDGFTIRRVTSGLLPQQHVIANRFSSESYGTAKMQDDDNDESDIEFEDSRIETPLSLKETTRSFAENGVHVRSTTIPLKTSGDSNGLSTPTKARSSFSVTRRKLSGPDLAISEQNGDISEEEGEIIRNSKLIGDENEFSPRLAHTSPSRPMRTSVFNKPLVDVEFEPSDHDLPKERDNIFVSPTKSKSEIKPLAAHTPRRLSPLRKEIVSSSSASDLVSKMAQSGATKPKTAREILQQINTSIDEMRAADIEADIEADLEADEVPIHVSGDEDILKSLDTYLPKVPSTPPQPMSSPVPKAVESLRKIVIPEKPPSPILSLVAPETTELKRDKARRRPTSRKLSGKYARDTLRKRKLTATSGKYDAWLYDKWGRLRMLVELSVPNNVIINSTIVMKELGCKTREELAQRVRFLAARK